MPTRIRQAAPQTHTTQAYFVEIEDEATELPLLVGAAVAEAELEVATEVTADVLDNVVTETVADDVVVVDVVDKEDVVGVVDAVSVVDVEDVVDVVRLVVAEEVVEEVVDGDEEVDAPTEEDELDVEGTAVSGRAPRTSARSWECATGVWTFVPREK